MKSESLVEKVENKIEKTHNKYGIYIFIAIIVLAVIYGMFIREPEPIYNGSTCYQYPDGSIDCPVAPPNPY